MLVEEVILSVLCVHMSVCLWLFSQLNHLAHNFDFGMEFDFYSAWDSIDGQGRRSNKKFFIQPQEVRDQGHQGQDHKDTGSL